MKYLKTLVPLPSDWLAIDAVDFEPDGGPCVLTLRDPWDWSDRRFHTEALLRKLGFYLDQIDEAHLVVAFPKAAGRQLVIEVDALHPLPEFGEDFLGELEALCELYRVKLRYRPPIPAP